MVIGREPRTTAAAAGLLLVLACGRTSDPAAAAPPPEETPAAVAPEPAEAPSPTATRPGLSEPPVDASIDAFDCRVLLEGEDRSGSLRGWCGGGPGGVAWNAWGDLTCEVEVSAACSGGARVALRAGAIERIVKAVPLAPGQSAAAAFVVAEAEWSAQLRPTEHAPWSALTLTATVDIHCESTEDGPAVGFHLADAFVAGFSGGE